MEILIKLAEIVAPIIIALIGIIPTIKNGTKTTKAAIDEIDRKLDEHIKDEEFKDAKACRVRILRFYDELCEGKMHSENHFEDIIEDINKYEAFCKAHTDFPNNKGQLAMEDIKDTYSKLKRKNAFLQPKGEI